MRYNIRAATDDWRMFEIVKRGRRPFSDPFAVKANDDDLAQIFAEIRLLIAAGCPPDRTRGNPEVEPVGKYKPTGLRQRLTVFILKAKPSGWRLYFYIKDRDEKEIEFLYSVHKKRDERDPADFDRCCRLLEDVFAGRTESEPFEVPPR